MFTEYDYKQPMLNVLIVQNNPQRQPCGTYPPMDEEGAAATLYRCDQSYAEVVTRAEAPKDWDPVKSELIFVHELGHAAGLAHDRYYSTREMFISVMTPNVGMHAYRWFWRPELSPPDKAALKARYCNVEKPTP